jgi:predicted ABC-type ATPase
MTPRFRMIAGPNGSGKTTLAAQLTSDYAVNFYLMLNADSLTTAK